MYVIEESSESIKKGVEIRSAIYYWLYRHRSTENKVSYEYPMSSTGIRQDSISHTGGADFDIPFLPFPVSQYETTQLLQTSKFATTFRSISALT